MTKSSISWSLVFAAILAVLQPYTALASSEIPDFPEFRFKSWARIDWLTRSDARYVLYIPETWNSFLSAPLERMSYMEVAEFLGLNNAEYISTWQRTNNALQRIAIDSKTWDCWINHYIANDWVDLRDTHNVSWAFEALGWNSSTWKSDDPLDWPETENKLYHEMSPEEILAADRICCPAEIWDGSTLLDWEINADGVSTVQLNFEAKYPRPMNAPTVPPTPLPTRFPTISPVVAATTEEEAEASVLDPSTDAPTEYVRFTDEPSKTPTESPSETPTTRSPSVSPSATRSAAPSASPSAAPTVIHSSAPTATHSMVPSDGPTTEPSSGPTATHSMVPSDGPTTEPSSGPTATHSMVPSIAPSDGPSRTPSLRPTRAPTASPSVVPSVVPSNGPTEEPTLSPSASPTVTAPIPCPANFTLILLTDKYPKETTWTLALDSSGELVAKSFGYKNDFETHYDTMCIQYDTCYMFEILDKWDDGLCCENGQGSYAGFIEYNGVDVDPLAIPGFNGGAFESSQRHKFCLNRWGDLVEEEGLGAAIGVRFNGRHGGT
jgi:hypothetical protein